MSILFLFPPQKECVNCIVVVIVVIVVDYQLPWSLETQCLLCSHRPLELVSKTNDHAILWSCSSLAYFRSCIHTHTHTHTIYHFLLSNSIVETGPVGPPGEPGVVIGDVRLVSSIFAVPNSNSILYNCIV